MSYNAIIVRLTDVRPHSNADRLQVCNALACNVIVGLEVKEDDIMVFFPTEGQLSNDMATNNGLYRKDPVTGEKASGYLDANARIRTLKLRGVESEGLVLPLTSLEWTGHDISRLKVGDEFDTLNKNKICEKFINKATRRAMAKAARAYKRPWWVPKFAAKYHKKYFVNRAKFDKTPNFTKHFDTNKLRLNLHNIPEDAKCIINLKVHGTSGRTAYTEYRSNNWIKRLFRIKSKCEYITGTRNVVKPLGFHLGKKGDDGYYGGTDFRGKIHKMFMGIGLRAEEAVFYECIGWAGEATRIMPPHSINKKDFKEAGFSSEDIKELTDQYGDMISYDYGCDPGEYKVRVYRITQNGVDLSWAELEERCKELGLTSVGKIKELPPGSDYVAECKKLEKEYERQDQLQEGLCLRFEDAEGKLLKVFKWKFFTFCVAESIKTNESGYVDLETIS